MTQQHVKDIIKLKAYLVVRENNETLYLLDKERIKEIARVIVEEQDDTKTS